MTGPGAGTSANPYKSLTYAISQQGLTPPSTKFMIAGRGGAFPYSTPNETFPISVPAWARLEYWNASGITPPSQPPAAKFIYAPTSGTTCFEFISQSDGVTKSGIYSYMGVYPLTLPDTNQGIEIWDFEFGISVDDSFPSGGNLDISLDGIAFFDCRTALKVSVNQSANSHLTISNALFRSPSTVTSWPTGKPVVDVEFSDQLGVASTFKFTLQAADFRPSDIATDSSMIVFRGADSDGNDLLDVTLRNLKITGQAAPPYQQGNPPPPPLGIGGIGIETGLKLGCRGRFSLENVSVRDALAGGFLGMAKGSDTFGSLATRNCSFRFNGASSNSGSYIVSQGWSAPSVLESGLHLVVREGASWEVNDARESFFNDNYRHGVFLDGMSYSDERDGFPLAEFDLCTFLRNGLELGSARGNGLFAELTETYVNLLVHRSALSGNFSSGLNLSLHSSETARVHELEVTNSTISQNQGANPEFSSNGKFYDTNPLSVVSKHAGNGLEMHLSHVTISDNPTSYAVSLYGDPNAAGDAQTPLWPDGSNSTVDNCVLNKNGFTGTSYSDQAYHPEPGPPPPALETQWDWIMEGTHHSNLGRDGALYWTRYTNANFNQVALDPLLEAFSFMGNAIGVVFPQSSSPLIDAGGGTRYASEATDNRGPGYPRFVNGFFDIGAFEIQSP